MRPIAQRKLVFSTEKLKDVSSRGLFQLTNEASGAGPAQSKITLVTFSRDKSPACMLRMNIFNKKIENKEKERDGEGEKRS